MQGKFLLTAMFAVFAVFSGPSAFAQRPGATPTIDVATPGWQGQLRAIGPGQRLRLAGLAAPPGLANSLSLIPFEVLSPDARLVVNGSAGPETAPFPERRYFRGRIDGDPRSLVVLSVGVDGDVRGLGRSDRGHLTLSADSGTSLALQDVDLSGVSEPFSCGNERLTPPPPDATAAQPTVDPRAITAALPQGAIAYEAKIAIETDYEFFAKFGNTTDATAYVTDLVAFASAVYSDEVNTAIVLSHLSLWTDSADPWSQSSTECALYEFGKYWNDNNSGVDRTIAHFLSGKSSNSGIAWIGVLCQSGFNVNTGGSCPGLGSQTANYGGDYGVSSGLDANFNGTSPNVVWDIVVFTHELGHNFDSPHTHCYAGLGGNASHVDECWGSESGGSCHSGPTSLPLGCEGSGQGCGTLMSYCHLRGGGLSNLALTLGLDSPYGVAPERVPSRMFDHVVERAAANPSCLRSVQTASVTLSGPASVVEGDAYPATLTLHPPQASAVTVDLAVGPELDGLLGNLTGHVIDAGESEITVSLSTIENTVFEPDVEGALQIDAVAGGEDVGIGTPASLMVTLLDDDAPPPVVATLGLDLASVPEGGTVVATVTLDQATTVDVDVTLGLDPPLAAGTASNLGPLTIAAGDTTAVFTLDFVDDAVATGDRLGNVFIAALVSDADATPGKPSSQVLAVVDDEVSLSIAGGGSVDEGAPVPVELVLDRAIDVPVVVDLTASPSFGGAISGLAGLVIPPGSASLTAELPTAQDAIYQGDRGGVVAIDAATSAGRTVLLVSPLSVPVTLVDDEPPPVVLTLDGDARVDEGEPINLTLALDQATTVDVLVTLAFDPALPLDAGADPGPHRIEAGATSLALQLPTVFDSGSAFDRRGVISLSVVSSDAAASMGSPMMLQVLVRDVDPGIYFMNSFEDP